MTFPKGMRVYEVGGFIRDSLLRIPSKDIDFAVEGPGSLADMACDLADAGFDVFQTNDSTFTVRARFPKGWTASPTVADGYGGLAADFVLCRKEGPYSDGRHPDWVQVGDLFDDLARRDFTVNAIAFDIERRVYIDPHYGREDIKHRQLRFVGNAQDRLTEDALRAVRGLRFIITKGLNPVHSTWVAITSEATAERLADNDIVSVERIREELYRMFKHDTRATLDLLTQLPTHTYDAIMRSGLWLEPTLKDR